MTFCCNCRQEFTVEEKRQEANEYVPANGGFRHKACPVPREEGS